MFLGAFIGIIDGVVVRDDPLLFELLDELCNLIRLIRSSHHDFQNICCEAWYVATITVKLNLLCIGSRLEVINLHNESTVFISKSRLERPDHHFVLAKYPHKVHLLHLHY